MKTRTHLGLRGAASPAGNVEMAIEALYRRCQAKNLSPHTASFYHYRLVAFKSFLTKHYPDMTPSQLSPTIIREFIANEMTRISAVTADDSFVTLRAFFRFLFGDGFIEKNPMQGVERPKQKKTVIATFSQPQLEAMLAACGNDFIGMRNRAIILTLVDCGLRVSELCGLEMSNINWTEQTLLVTGKGNKERVVPFGRTTRSALLNYFERRGDSQNVNAFFLTCYGDPMSRQCVYHTLAECGRLAKISGVRVSPHTFRHTCAVMYLRNGGDVFSLQKLLGHTDLTMTRRYAELSQADVIEKHRQYSPADSIKSPNMCGRKRLR